MKTNHLKLYAIVALFGSIHQLSLAQATLNSNALTGTLPGSPGQYLGSSNAADVIFRSQNIERFRIINGTNAIISLPSTTNLQTSVAGGFKILGLQGHLATAPAYSFNVNGEAGLGMFRPAANALGFATNGGERIRITSGGSVGIGTISPAAKLDVTDPTNAYILTRSTAANVESKIGVATNLYSYGFRINGSGTLNSSGNTLVQGQIVGNLNLSSPDAIISYNSNGNVVIGEKNVNTAIDQNNQLFIKSSVLGLQIQTTHVNGANQATPYGYNTLFNVNHNLTKSIAIQNQMIANNALKETFFVYGNGSVNINSEIIAANQPMLAINSANPSNVYEKQFVVYADGRTSIGELNGEVPNGYKLAVNGKIITEEVLVSLRANWPDYVFKKNYNLKSIDELDTYIKTHKHLPNIPSASEMQGGIETGSMLTKQMEKIEELTLYIIEQNKIVKAQNQKLEEQEKRLKALEEKLK